MVLLYIFAGIFIGSAAAGLVAELGGSPGLIFLSYSGFGSVGAFIVVVAVMLSKDPPTSGRGPLVGRAPLAFVTN